MDYGLMISDSDPLKLKRCCLTRVDLACVGIAVENVNFTPPSGFWWLAVNNPTRGGMISGSGQPAHRSWLALPVRGLLTFTTPRHHII